jgi:predicted  nucleic acid-binding Zn-ribbon protein
MIADTNPQNNQPCARSVSDMADPIRSLLENIEMLVTRVQHLEQKYTNLKKRQSYLEYDLHNANANLKAENLGLRQQVDYPSDD